MKKKAEFNLKEEVDKEIKRAEKMMDPGVKKRLIILITSVISIIILAIFISLVPRDSFDEKDNRIKKNLTYSQLIKNMKKAGFEFEGKKNPEGYILLIDKTTYLIKKFYKENFINYDFTIYAYSNYNQKKGFVISKTNDKYKVYNYDRNITIFCNDNGEILEESYTNMQFYNDNSQFIRITIDKLELLSKNIFGSDENEK